YSYAVSEVLRDCDVVSDDEQGEIHLPLEIQEELQNLGPNGDVEHGHRLVSHHELWVKDQRSGNHHPLSLASTQFMGEPGVDLLWGVEAHAAHHLEGPLPLLYLSSDAVKLQRLRYGVPDSDPRIERRHRVLIDHLRCPPELLERFTAQPSYGLAVEENVHCRGNVYPEAELAESRLPAAAFACEDKDLPLLDAEGDTVHCPDVLRLRPDQPLEETPPYGEVHLDVLEEKQRVAHFRPPSYRWQAALWPGSISRRLGRSFLHRSKTKGHRAANLHPDIG